MNSPLVSVIIPAYNCTAFICQALDSALAQDVPVEIIVVNDCSQDCPMWLKMLKKYGKCCAINEPLLKYRITNTGKFGNKLNSAKMNYRYMGLGVFKSNLCFINFAFHGIKNISVGS